MSKVPARVCAVIAEPTIEAAQTAISRAAGLADLIELRLDYLSDFDFTNVDELRPLLENKPLPVVITCRSVEEGGQKRVDHDVRLGLLVEGAKRFADYCDIEAAHYSEAASLSPDLSRLIVSYHNFRETPADLDKVYDRVTALPAAVHKIVTHATDISDSLAVLRLLDRARSAGKQLIALAMGGAGVVTRILGPSRGSFLTYASLGSGRESAAGQPTCDELINLYRIRQLSRDTAVTGIIGSPVSHSASPAMHNRAFADLGLEFVYLPLEVDNIESFFTRFVRKATSELDWNLRGFSVTIPYKRDVRRFLDGLDQTASDVGAVNTVVIDEGRLIGYNTDVRGAMEPLERAVALEGENCAVIGAGGAAHAVVHGLKTRGARVALFARDQANARALGERFNVDVLPLDAFSESDASVVINTTPVGMRGHAEASSPVPRESLRGRRVAYDLVYNPLDTQFLIDARAEGCRTLSGLEMLLAQAALQFKLWTGQAPPIKAMRQAAMERLTAQPS
ncbi:MAG TPA: shikimate dehydrogenase [Blastocatellia bacterium]|nr:shikimate dehydrogenase [Blastocatellia bacterium]